MEDFYLHEEMLMLPGEGQVAPGPRRMRQRRDHFTDMSDREFKALTRFTKEGVERLAGRLEGRLQSATARNPPLTPLEQVIRK